MVLISTLSFSQLDLAVLNGQRLGDGIKIIVVRCKYPFSSVGIVQMQHQSVVQLLDAKKREEISSFVVTYFYDKVHLVDCHSFFENYHTLCLKVGWTQVVERRGLRKCAKTCSLLDIFL